MRRSRLNQYQNGSGTRKLSLLPRAAFALIPVERPVRIVSRKNHLPPKLMEMIPAYRLRSNRGDMYVSDSAEKLQRLSRHTKTEAALISMIFKLPKQDLCHPYRPNRKGYHAT